MTSSSVQIDLTKEEIDLTDDGKHYTTRNPCVHQHRMGCFVKNIKRHIQDIRQGYQDMEADLCALEAYVNWSDEDGQHGNNRLESNGSTQTLMEMKYNEIEKDRQKYLTNRLTEDLMTAIAEEMEEQAKTLILTEKHNYNLRDTFKDP